MIVAQAERQRELVGDVDDVVREDRRQLGLAGIEVELARYAVVADALAEVAIGRGRHDAIGRRAGVEADPALRGGDALDHRRQAAAHRRDGAAALLIGLV